MADEKKTPKLYVVLHEVAGTLTKGEKAPADAFGPPEAVERLLGLGAIEEAK